MSESHAMKMLRSTQRFQYLMVFATGFFTCATIFDAIDGIAVLPSALLLVFCALQIPYLESSKHRYQERLNHVKDGVLDPIVPKQENGLEPESLSR